MKTNKSKSVILIENPLCGNKSLAESLDLEISVGEWEIPAEVRKDESINWSEVETYILVRDVKERFLSGVSLACQDPSILKSSKASEGVSESLEEICNTQTNDYAYHAAQFVKVLSSADTSEWPVFLRPQSDWLSSKFTYTLRARDLVEFCGSKSLKNPLRGKSFNRGRNTKVLNQESEEGFRKLYSADFDRFTKLRLWAEDDTRVRLIDGYCEECEQKLAAKNSRESRKEGTIKFSETQKPKQAKKKK